MKQKRFKKVVEKEHSWAVVIGVFLLDLLFFTQGMMTNITLINICCYPILLEFLSYIISLMGIVLIFVSITLILQILKSIKVYYVEVKE